MDESVFPNSVKLIGLGLDNPIAVCTEEPEEIQVQVGGPEAQPELSVQQPELSGAAQEPQLSHAVQEAQVSGDVQEPQVMEHLRKQGPVINAWNCYAPEVEADALDCAAEREPFGVSVLVMSDILIVFVVGKFTDFQNQEQNAGLGSKLVHDHMSSSTFVGSTRTRECVLVILSAGMGQQRPILIRHQQTERECIQLGAHEKEHRKVQGFRRWICL
ncbi:unnamed protein product, partial [Menidia menidia]